MRLLERPRCQRDIGDLVKAALVDDPLLGPCAHDYLECLLEAVAALVTRHVEALEVHRDRSAADAVLQTAPRQQVGGGGFLGGAQRMMERQQRHRGAETDMARVLRGRDRDHQRRGHDREVSEKVQLGHPRDVEAELVGEHDLLDGLLVAHRLGLLRSTGQLVEKAELHDFTPSRRLATASLCGCSRADPREEHAGALARLSASLHNACRYGNPRRRARHVGGRLRRSWER